MSRKSITKDERFLLELFQLLNETKSESIPLSDMEAKLRLTHTNAKHIAHLLAQTGFVLYSHRQGVLSITKKGEALSKELLR